MEIRMGWTRAIFNFQFPQTNIWNGCFVNALMVIYSEIVIYELTDLLCEVVKGYKRDILENSIRNWPLDHNNRQWSNTTLL